MIVSPLTGIFAERYGTRYIGGVSLIAATILTTLTPISANILVVAIIIRFFTGIVMVNWTECPASVINNPVLYSGNDLSDTSSIDRQVGATRGERNIFISSVIKRNWNCDRLVDDRIYYWTLWMEIWLLCSGHNSRRILIVVVFYRLWLS